MNNQRDSDVKFRDDFISIIIPTYGRDKELRALLQSICELRIPCPYEILIIDQNEDGKIDSIVQEYCKVIDINHFKVVFKGAARARNYGFSKSKGNLVCFPDDDAKFMSETMMNALIVLRDNKADCISGRLVDEKTGENAMIPFPKKKKILSVDNMDDSFVEPAMFYERAFLEQYPFDEDMGVGTIYGAHEGYDQIYRGLLDGHKIVYDPDIVFYHPMKKWTGATGDEIRRAFYYSCGLGHLCKKHNLKKKYKKRFWELTFALPVIAVAKHKKFRYFFAQWMGILLGYRYI